MRVALSIHRIPADHVPPLAVEAERVGFDTVWLPDHVVTPVEIASRYPYTTSGKRNYGTDAPLNDIWVLVGYVAALTRRVRLGTGVYLLPLRNPLITARAALTTQTMSDGRFILGVGSGWLREEFHALGESFETRGARTNEILQLLPRLWSGRPIEHDGAHYAFPPVHVGPMPSARIPLFVGGLTAPALHRAALFGDGWYGPDCPLKQARAARARIEELRAETGRASHPFEYVARLQRNDGHDALARYAEAGFGHVTVSLRDLLHERDDGTVATRRDVIARAADTLIR